MRGVKKIVLFILSRVMLLIIRGGISFSRSSNSRDLKELRLVWGPVPIKNNSYWSAAMKKSGYSSQTYTYNYFKGMNKRADWDLILDERYTHFPAVLKPYLAFMESLKKFDVFFLPFGGYFLGETPLMNKEAQLLKRAGKYTVVIPYGADAYVYKRIKSITLQHALLKSYPHAAKNQNRIEEKVDYWVRHGDVVLPGIMGPDGFGRWDLLAPSFLNIDLNEWKTSEKQQVENSTKNPIKIVHAPNHRGFKGSEFIVEAVKSLRLKGLNVELVLLEKLPNEEVKRVLNEETDILVEQLICPGHGLNALEGMSSGVTVISNLENEEYTLPMRRWSHLNECPIVSATPENIESVLRYLIENPQLRSKLGALGRSYAEKYHSLEAGGFFFTNVLKHIVDGDPIVDLFHPHNNRSWSNADRIETPLTNNKLDHLVN